MDNRLSLDKRPKVVSSPIGIYWEGLDIISRNCLRTKSYEKKPRDSGQFREYSFWRYNLVIWACCAIESFVNLEGVSCLGKKFHEFERNGIGKKVELIHSVKCNKALLANDDTIGNMKALFEQRNRLVHPKTSVLDKDDSITKDDKTNALRIGDLELFAPDRVTSIVKAVNDLISSAIIE